MGAQFRWGLDERDRHPARAACHLFAARRPEGTGGHSLIVGTLRGTDRIFASGFE